MLCHGTEKHKYFALPCHLCSVPSPHLNVKELLALKGLGSYFMVLAQTCWLKWVVLTGQNNETSAPVYWPCRDWPKTGPSVLYGQLTPLLGYHHKFLSVAFGSWCFSTNCHLYSGVICLVHSLEVKRWTWCSFHRTSSLAPLTATESKSSSYSQLLPYSFEGKWRLSAFCLYLYICPPYFI